MPHLVAATAAAQHACTDGLHHAGNDQLGCSSACMWQREVASAVGARQSVTTLKASTTYAKHIAVHAEGPSHDVLFCISDALELAACDVKFHLPNLTRLVM
jgi:hypothetical protein